MNKIIPICLFFFVTLSSIILAQNLCNISVIPDKILINTYESEKVITVMSYNLVPTLAIINKSDNLAQIIGLNVGSTTLNYLNSFNLTLYKNNQDINVDGYITITIDSCIVTISVTVLAKSDLNNYYKGGFLSSANLLFIKKGFLYKDKTFKNYVFVLVVNFLLIIILFFAKPFNQNFFISFLVFLLINFLLYFYLK